MKTEVRKEHGDWIVFVDDNPQFSFMYREEAEKVRNMVEALGSVYNFMWQHGWKNTQECKSVEKALKDAEAL